MKYNWKFRRWFDNLFPSSGFAGYSPFYAFTHPHKIVEFCWDEIRWAWQRVFRGWDDRVVWSIDIHLSENIPVWLEKLKSNKQGCPVEFFDDPYDTNSTDEDVSKAKEKWENELQIMIDGFLASKKIQDSEYNSGKEFEELEETFEKGMASFTRYYFNLWD